MNITEVFSKKKYFFAVCMGRANKDTFIVDIFLENLASRIAIRGCYKKVH